MTVSHSTTEAERKTAEARQVFLAQNNAGMAKTMMQRSGTTRLLLGPNPTCGELDPNPGVDYQEARSYAISKLLQETVDRNYAMFYRKVSRAGTLYLFARCCLDISHNDCQRCLEYVDQLMYDDCIGVLLDSEDHHQDCDMKFNNHPFEASQ